MMAKSVYKTVIFGAGQIGQMTARLLSSPCQLLCFADNDPHKHGSYIGNIPVCSPDTAAALLPDLVILGVLDEERRNSMIKQMENLGYHGPFRDPSVLRMFDARVAVMRLLSEQIYQLDIPGNVAELGVFRVASLCAIVTMVFPLVSSDMAVWIRCSFSGSTLAVASSSIIIGASFRIALAMEMRCFSPPDRLPPPSPITVS